VKNKLIGWVLWLAFILAMVSSLQHIAWTFGTVERVGQEWLGWIPAIAVDAGLAALAYTIQQRRKAKRPVAVLWAGVGIFAIISALANLYHALSVEVGGFTTLAAIGTIDALLIAKAVFLSATLPALVVYLSEIISGDDAAAARTSEQAAAKAEAKAEREQRREDLSAEREAAEAKRLLLEAEQTTLIATLPASISEIHPAHVVVCETCEREFSSMNALNAHRRAHQNGKAHEVRE
jgi:hypothetical protein